MTANSSSKGWGDNGISSLKRRLWKTDKHLVALLAQRVLLATQLKDAYRQEGETHNARTLDEELIGHIGRWAGEYRVDPGFVTEIMKVLNDEVGNREITESAVAPDYKQLRQNLLDLTQAVVLSYPNGFDDHYHATRAYRRFELVEIQRALVRHRNTSQALDLGCATGTYASRLARRFSRVIGVDVSPAMINRARELHGRQGDGAPEFLEHDLDLGVPADDSSVSLIIMNLGTASEVAEASFLLKETARVLRPGGQAIFSFYNSDALVYRDLIPWGLSLAAEVNLRSRCLDVHFNDRIYSIHAQPYNLSQIEALLPEGVKISHWRTYPTIGSILPNDLFEEESVRSNIESIDEESLSNTHHGNYLFVVCAKAS